MTEERPLVNYQCNSYKQQSAVWRYLDDVFQGSDSWMERSEDGTVKATTKSRKYLPQEHKELGSNYENRLSRSPFSDRYAQAIRDFVGLIFVNEIQAILPGALALHWDNLDGQGTTGEVLLQQIAIAAMRRGHTFVMVDTDSTLPQSQADAMSRRPRWLHIEAPSVINWRHEGDRLVKVVIEERGVIADGEYGEREETTYLVLTPGHYDRFRITKNPADGKLREEYLPERSGQMGFFRNGVLDPLPSIPLFPIYGGDRLGHFRSKPPLKVLADLNIAHYQTHSDHRNKVHKCCFPVPVRVGVMGAQQELVLSPDIVIDAPPGGGFAWQEPNANSLQWSRQEMIDLEQAMDFLSAQYLIKPSDRQAAASTMVQAAKVESSLYQFAKQFESGINQVMATHQMMMQSSEKASITLDTRFFEGAADSQLIMALTRLGERDILDKRGILESLKRIGYPFDAIDIDDLIRRTGDQIRLEAITPVVTQPTP
jgi:hypothetical protein